MDPISYNPLKAIIHPAPLRLSKHTKEEDTIRVVIQNEKEEGPVRDEGHTSRRIGEVAEDPLLDRVDLSALFRELDHHAVHAVLHLQTARREEALHVGVRGEQILDAHSDESLGITVRVLGFPSDGQFVGVSLLCLLCMLLLLSSYFNRFEI